MRLVLALALAVGCSRTPPAAQLTWIQGDEPAAFAQAKSSHRGVLVFFDATWAQPCAELERELHEPALARLVTDNFAALRIDVSNGTDADTAIRAKYHAATLPAIVVVSTDGTVLAKIDRLVDPKALSAALEPAVAALHR